MPSGSAQFVPSMRQSTAQIRHGLKKERARIAASLMSFLREG
jgi:hypothetical protein